MYVSHSEMIVLRDDLRMLADGVLLIKAAMDGIDLRLKHLEEEAAWNKHDDSGALAPEVE